MRKRYSGIGHILMLHRVLPEEKQSRLDANRMMEISPDFLRQSIEFYISNGYDIVSLDEVYRRIISRDSPNRFVSYTFDDGYKDILDYTLPIFKEYDLPFTLYLTSGMPDGTLVLWWLILDDILTRNNSLKLEYDNYHFDFDLSTKTDKDRTFYQISDIINNSSVEKSQSMIKGLLSPYINDIEDISKINSLSWDDVNKLLMYDKFTLGAHSVNHLSYKQLEDHVVLNETLGSLDRIFEKSSIRPEHFAYPYGSRGFVGKRESQLVSSLNLRTSVTSRQGSLYFEHSDYLSLLPRYHVYSFKTGRNDLFELFDSGSITALANKFQKFITL